MEANEDVLDDFSDDSETNEQGEFKINKNAQLL